MELEIGKKYKAPSPDHERPELASEFIVMLIDREADEFCAYVTSDPLKGKFLILPLEFNELNQQT